MNATDLWPGGSRQLSWLVKRGGVKVVVFRLPLLRGMAAVALNIEFKNGRMMNQPINHSKGHRSFWKHLIPTGKRLIRRQC
jgi:hypothetical protein